jgi:hypothetical protein
MDKQRRNGTNKQINKNSRLRKNRISVLFTSFGVTSPASNPGVVI